MAVPIRIGTLDATEASDLVQALAARGLIGRPLGADGERWVEVHDAHEETRRLLTDVIEAVETWLAEHDRDAVDVSVEGRLHRVTVGDDLRDALRARIRAQAGTPDAGGGGSQSAG